MAQPVVNGHRDIGGLDQIDSVDPAHLPESTRNVESRSIDYVPENERHGKVWQQGPFWFLGNFQFFSVAVGFTGVGFGLSLFWAGVALVLGYAFGTFFMAFHASQGPQLGLPQMIQSRAQLGYRGVSVVLVGALFTFMGFLVLDTTLIDSGLHGIYGWNKIVVGIVINVVSAVLAIFGHDWLHRAFRLLFWVSIPFVVVLTLGIIFGQAGGHAPAAAGFGWVGFMAQFAAAAAYNITYAPYVSDYSRYLPKNTKPSHLVASVFWGAAGSAVWLGLIGVWLASRLDATDALVSFKLAGDNVFSGLGTILAVVSVLALVATMGIGVYSGMLTALTGLDSFRPIATTQRQRIVTILLLESIATVVGLLLPDNYLTSLFNTLSIMLYLLVPWTALNLVDFFIVRRGHYAITDLVRPAGVYGIWAWRGLTAFGAGLVSMVPFMVLPTLYRGPIARHIGGVDISFVVGLLVSGVVYWVLARSIDMDADRRAIAASEAELSAELAAATHAHTA
jgi:NCS1 family nucleobase:cation symporter-1